MKSCFRYYKHFFHMFSTTLLTIPSVLMILATFPVFATEGMGTVKNPQKRPQIVDFIRPRGNIAMVILSTGTRAGFDKDALLVSRRLTTRPGASDGDEGIPTGHLRVISATESQAIAVILEDGSELSKALFVKYPGVMAGDFVEIEQPQINLVTQVTPVVEMRYLDLFIDPMDSPHSYELSEPGKKRLAEAMALFDETKTPLVMIEGHTDDKGPQDSNQVESYQRALTVQQYVIEELKFSSDRISAVGLGETDFNATDYLPDYRQRARRIVIKAVGNAF